MPHIRIAHVPSATRFRSYVCSGVEGVDVGSLLRAALSRAGLSASAVSVEAVINDTTGCLLACAYKRPDCAVGVILGTGTNASYVEDTRNVEIYEGDGGNSNKGSVVVNTEWGAFGNTGSLDIIRTAYDRRLDDDSVNPGKQVGFAQLAALDSP